MNLDVARAAVMDLLGRREPGATICPSEVARKLASGACGKPEWRDAMPVVHAAVDSLVDQGHIQLSWKGRALAARSGPYRIAPGGGGP